MGGLAFRIFLKIHYKLSFKYLAVNNIVRGFRVKLGAKDFFKIGDPFYSSILLLIGEIV